MNSAACAAYVKRLNEALAEGWQRFWFVPSSARRLGALRIVVGAATAVALAAYYPDLERWFAPGGMMPLEFIRDLYPWQATPLDRLPAGWLLPALVAAVALASLFAAGIGGRWIGVGCWIAAASFFQRAPFACGPFEAVTLPLIAYLCVGRAGDAWSLRAGRSSGPAVPGTTVSNTIALRLIQIHIALVHAMMAVAQLSAAGNVWLSGEGMWLAAAHPEIAWYDFGGLAEQPRLAALWSHAVTAYLLALPILAWRRLLAPLLLAAGACVWLSVAVATGQALFAAVMWAGAWCFLEPDAAQDAP